MGSVGTAPAYPPKLTTPPEELVRRCLQLYSYRGDLVVDAFCGRGTTPALAVGLGRRIRASDLSSTYVDLTKERAALARAAAQP